MKAEGILYATIYLVLFIFIFLFLYTVLTPMFQEFLNIYTDLLGSGNTTLTIVKNMLSGIVAFALAIPITYFLVYAFRREPREVVQ